MSCNYALNLSPYPNKGELGLPEKFDPPEKMSEKIKILADLIKESNHIVLHTGAGISTAAGIPDFRGPKGVWTLEEKGLKPDLDMCFLDAKPTVTHMAINKLVQEGIVKYVVSQNIDGLHLRSGLTRKNLAELHGNVFIEQCNKCKRQYISNQVTSTIGQKCLGKSCSGSLSGRPCRGKLFDTVLDWDHCLPDKDLDLADYHSCLSDLSICLGTSLQIKPSGVLPLSTKKYGGRLVICNLQRTKYDPCADLIINGYVDNIMKELMTLLNLSIPEYGAHLDPVRTNVPGVEWTILHTEVRQMKSSFQDRYNERKQLFSPKKRKSDDEEDVLIKLPKKMVKMVKDEMTNELENDSSNFDMNVSKINIKPEEAHDEEDEMLQSSLINYEKNISENNQTVEDDEITQSKNVSEHDNVIMPSENIGERDNIIIVTGENVGEHDDIIMSDDKNVGKHDDIIMSDDKNVGKHDDIIMSDDENVSKPDELCYQSEKLRVKHNYIENVVEHEKQTNGDKLIETARSFNLNDELADKLSSDTDEFARIPTRLNNNNTAEEVELVQSEGNHFENDVLPSKNQSSGDELIQADIGTDGQSLSNKLPTSDINQYFSNETDDVIRIESIDEPEVYCEDKNSQTKNNCVKINRCDENEIQTEKNIFNVESEKSNYQLNNNDDEGINNQPDKDDEVIPIENTDKSEEESYCENMKSRFENECNNFTESNQIENSFSFNDDQSNELPDDYFDEKCANAEACKVTSNEVNDENERLQIEDKNFIDYGVFCSVKKPDQEELLQTDISSDNKESSKLPNNEEYMNKLTRESEELTQNDNEPGGEGLSYEHEKSKIKNDHVKSVFERTEQSNEDEFVRSENNFSLVNENPKEEEEEAEVEIVQSNKDEYQNMVSELNICLIKSK